MAPKLLYPTNCKLDTVDWDVLKGFAITPHAYDVQANIPDEHTDAEIMITWDNASQMLKDAASRLTKIKWIQSFAAGPNELMTAGFDPRKITITTGSGCHDETVAEHALGLLLLAARRFDEMLDYQRRAEWPGHLGGPRLDKPHNRFTTLNGANVLIWGFGNIAKRLTPSLRVLGASVRGVARSAGVRDGVEVIDDAGLDKALGETDALVMILPGQNSTHKALNAARIKQLPAHAWVVNVGRGSTVDEDALVDALNGDRLGGAALDVFVTEPLPSSSSLWQAKNCIVSPHAAGGRPRGVERLVEQNVRRFLAGQELINVLSPS